MSLNLNTFELFILYDIASFSFPEREEDLVSKTNPLELEGVDLLAF